MSGTGTIVSAGYNGWSTAINVGDKLFYLKLGTSGGVDFNYYAADDSEPITVTITEATEENADLFMGTAPNVKYYTVSFGNLVDGDNTEGDGVGSYKSDPTLLTSTVCSDGQFGVVNNHPTLSLSTFIEGWQTLPNNAAGYGFSFYKKPAAE